MEDRKDIGEWFDLFPGLYREKAYAANEKSGRTAQLREEYALEDSVDIGIVWSMTDEGQSYWKRIHDGLAHSGLAFFNDLGVAEEPTGLDKSTKPAEAADTGLARFRGHPELVKGSCNIKMLRAVWPTPPDIAHAVDTDREHRYWHSHFTGTPDILRGTVISGIRNDRDGNYQWRTIGAYEPGMELPYLVRWLPEAQFNGGLVNYAKLGVDHTPPEYAEKTPGWWFSQFPEPYRAWALEAMVKYPNCVKRTDSRFNSAADAIYYGIGFDKAKRAGLGDWEKIHVEMKRDPEYLKKCAFHGGTPVKTTTTTTTTTTEGTHMKNATYSVAKLIAKATAELSANTKAVAQYKATNAANLAYINAVRDLMQPTADGKDKPELAALRVVTLPEAIAKLAPTDSVTGAASRGYFRITTQNIDVVDYTARLARILTDLDAISGDEISWNEDIDFVLRDFTRDNGSEIDTFHEDISIPAPRG